LNIKSDDNVVVLSGRDRGKQGKVLKVFPDEEKAIVENIHIAVKHQKPRRQGEQGGIIRKETPIYTSKLQVVCPKCDKPTRVAHKIEDGKKSRVCKKCGAEL